ncbi:MAG TPA: hypothetical protein VFS16_08325 [Acidimicrobiia bacterium]|nr:hypothetical protein [Acidimicrobiia bacterium]
MRVAALEDNVAFLEEWCEEQQDALDRTAGPVGYDYELDPEPACPAPRAVLRVVDLRDGAAGEETEAAQADSIFAVVETEYDRRIHQIRSQINRLRSRLALSVAPPSAEDPPAPRRTAGKGGASAAGRKSVSAKPAGRTAP